jgi:hypothetical protein
MGLKLWRVSYEIICDLTQKERDFIELVLGQPNINNNFVITEDDLENIKEGLKNEETKEIAKTLLELYEKYGDVEINIDW